MSIPSSLRLSPSLALYLFFALSHSLFIHPFRVWRICLFVAMCFCGLFLSHYGHSETLLVTVAVGPPPTFTQPPTQPHFLTEDVALLPVLRMFYFYPLTLMTLSPECSFWVAFGCSFPCLLVLFLRALHRDAQSIKIFTSPFSLPPLSFSPFHPSFQWKEGRIFPAFNEKKKRTNNEPQCN